MDSRLTILIELREISPLLAGITPVTPYVVPDGYFEGLANQVMQRVKLGEDPIAELAGLSPLLSSISKQIPYQVPEHYFSELSEQALGGAKAIEFVNEELENLSPMMIDLKHVNVYDVPAGYFDSLSSTILNKAKQHQPAKVVTMPFRRVVRFAVAAMLIGLMAIGGWFIQKPAQTTMPVAKIEKGIHNASDEEILNFVEGDGGSIAEQTVLNTDEEIDSADMKVMLADISDKELEQFINEPVDQTN